MDTDQEQKAGDGLRALAEMIVRDGVSGKDLREYLKYLIEDHLLEPDAHARRFARKLPSQLQSVTIDELSQQLRLLADEIDAKQQ